MKVFKKTIGFFAVIIFFILIQVNCSAVFTVQPPEIKITLTENLHSSRIVSVSNYYNQDFNVTWYLEKPPRTYMRPNRTAIPDSSWVDVNPKYMIIKPDETAIFTLDVDIPANLQNYDKRWEVWLTFKPGKQEQGFFKIEQAIRVLIDTPEYDGTIQKTQNIEIDMKNNFIHGNTSQKISIKNKYLQEININPIVVNPTVGLNQDNYTNIPDLSWIAVNPGETIIKPGETKDFYVFIDPVEKKEYTQKYWEAWIFFEACFTDDPNDCFELDQKAKIFIKTPVNFSNFIDQDKNLKGTSVGDSGTVSIGSIGSIILLFFILIAFFVVLRKKRRL